jgi:proton-coupled amino acid transporter
MKKPEQFTSIFGILNVGLFIITVVFILMGSVTYMKYGEDVKGSISLNLPPGEM